MSARNIHAGLPFDDEAIAAALLDVSIPTLLLSLVHMTGDPEIIRGEFKPVGTNERWTGRAPPRPPAPTSPWW